MTSKKSQGFYVHCGNCGVPGRLKKLKAKKKQVYPVIRKKTGTSRSRGSFGLKKKRGHFRWGGVEEHQLLLWRGVIVLRGGGTCTRRGRREIQSFIKRWVRRKTSKDAWKCQSNRIAGTKRRILDELRGGVS